MRRTALCPRSPLALLAILPWLLAPQLGALAAQTTACAPDVRQIPEREDPLGYRPRGARCEGRYHYEPFSNATLRVVGFTERFDGYPLDARQSLPVEWSLPEDMKVSLEAVALAPRTYYRMDASPPPAARATTWPLDVLAPLGLGRERIGALAHAAMPVGGTAREVLVPLRIGDEAGAAEDPNPALVLVPGAELRAVYWSLLPVLADGSEGSPLVEEEALGLGYYPAGRAFEIRLPGLAGPGIYAVEIGVETRSGSPDGLKLWIYDDGRTGRGTSHGP